MHFERSIRERLSFGYVSSSSPAVLLLKKHFSVTGLLFELKLTKSMKKVGVGEIRNMSVWKPKIDGGWGWIVVVGSFLVHVFADGIVYSFGVLMPHFMKEFNSSNAECSTILALLAGITLSVGPLASVFANHWGCRLTTVLGSAIATIGCLASLAANSVTFLMGTVGCVMGFGAGFMYCPAIIIVTVYFEKKRAMATGIAVCGAGVGVILIAPIVERVVSFAGWRAAFYFYAVLLVLCSVCGMTFRPLPFVKVDEEEVQKELEKKDEEKIDFANNELGNGDIKLQSVESKALLEKKLRPYLSHSALNSDLNERVNNDVKKTTSLLEINSRPIVMESTGFLDIKDVFFTGSVTALEKEDRMKFRSLTKLQPEPQDVFKDEAAAGDTQLPGEQNRRFGITSLVSSFNKILDLRLLLDPIFLLFAVSNFLTSIGFNAPLLFIPSHAVQLGLSKDQGAYILAAFGALNTIGRITFGVISDRTLPTRYGKDVKRNRLWIYIVSLCICGLVTCFVFICRTFFSLLIYAAAFGFSISSYVCLTSVLLVDLLGLDNLTSAFGILLLFQGIATFIGPPLSGKLADIMDRQYDWAFTFCGVCLLISGVMLFAIIPIRRWRSRKANRLAAEVKTSSN